MSARPALRIGLDLHAFDGPHQGIRSHVLGVFPEVVARCPEFEFKAFVGDREGLLRTHPAWALPNVELVRLPSHSSSRRLLVDLPRLARRHALDLLHVQYVAPPRCPVPFVVTLHDVLFETHPELFPLGFRLRSRLLMRRTARAARHVVTVSRYSREEIARAYAVDPARLSVVPNAVDGERFAQGAAGSAGDARVLAGRGLDSDGYLLSVGRLDRRKNVALLAEAHARLSGEAPPLVLVGKPGLGAESVLRALAPHREAGRVLLFDDVDDAELPALYRGARVFCYPSAAEGFGMPPLEAMAAGTPVVVSDATALPEVVGDAGVLVPPGDERALTAALDALLQDPGRLQSLAAAGRERAGRSSWGAGARELARAYRGLAAA